MPAIMIQGTGSNVGKSLIVAGLCRAAYHRGLKVLPFKPQNMSNNAAVTIDGGEVGRAQALQALACKADLMRDMNPILLKPESEKGAQVIVQGQHKQTMKAREYFQKKSEFLPIVLESFRRLEAQADLVIVEGAGSPAEVNLRKGDIANMGFAEAANIPVLLLGDIDRGGVIAQIIGTKAVLSPSDAARIKGFLINKFRGDPSLFDEGLDFIEQQSDWKSFGVLPYFEAAYRLPAEDALDIRAQKPQSRLASSRAMIKIAALKLNRIANFDDLDPLALEENVRFHMIEPGNAIDGDLDLVIIPGSKSTIADLQALKAQGWDIDLMAHYRRGGRILGICGGYQMLGKSISDPHNIEGSTPMIEGLGFLNIKTIMQNYKTLGLREARHIPTGEAFSGYEIHIGQSAGADCARPFAHIGERIEGAMSADGQVMGTYMHGMFGSDEFRKAFLTNLGLGVQASSLKYEYSVDQTLDELAAHIENSVDMEAFLSIALGENRR